MQKRKSPGIAFVGGTVIDPSGSAQSSSTVLVEKSRITRVGSKEQVTVPSDFERIDASGMTIIPGLMDLHVHVCSVPGQGGAGDYASPDKVFTPNSYLALWGAYHATLMLEAGFTTIKDAWGLHRQTEILSVRRAIEAGIVKGPRILAAGYAGASGGTVLMRIPPEIELSDEWAADGPWEMRKRVRELMRDGYDWIKTINSGGRISGGQEEDVWYNNLTLEEMEAITDEAHTFGSKVMAHASSRDSISLAIEGNADTVEHGWPLDQELIEGMIKKGIYLCPTISVYSERGFLRDGIDPALHNRAANQFENRMNSFRRAYQAGVKIIAGSDIAPGLATMSIGQNVFEIEFMVRQGMKPIDAIQSATKVGAESLGMENQLGTIDEGKIADIVAIKGNPLEDIRRLESNLSYVMKGGEIVVSRAH